MFPDTDYPALPYPGTRPDRSFVHDDGTGWPLRPDRAALSGWRLASGEDLDDWLGVRGAAPLAGRVPVLCYGSNACPSKLTWLRGTLGLVGPAVLVRARCTGLAAVWAAGLRVVDDQRPATLTAMPGVTEAHAVWFATPDQVRVLDRCEGRGDRYRLARVTTGEVRLDGGALVEPLAYVAASESDGASAGWTDEQRSREERTASSAGGKPAGSGGAKRAMDTVRYPLLVDGRPVRCADVPQAAAAALVGEAAAGDGLAVLAVDGEPVPEDHPGRVFVYGTLRPDASHWPMLAPYTAGEPRRAELAGTLFDTGLGYPALRLGGPGVAGWVVDLTAPAAALSILDEYEGREYRRTRVVLDDDTVAWTYVWIDPFDGLPRLTTPWGTT